MKFTATIALFVAAAYVSPAFAQGNVVQANIPFAFTVNGTTLMPGTYTIRAGNGSSRILSLLDRAHGSSILTMAQPGDPVGVKDNVLVFHHYGDQYFLSAIRTQGSSMNYAFAPTKAEKQARTLTEEAKLSTSTPVLIALK